MKLIDKDAVLAEIERRKEKCELFYNVALSNNAEFAKLAIEEQKKQYDSLKDFIDTLEVKEVDLEKELIKWHKEHFKKDGTFIGMSGFYLTNSSQIDIAKHFFELGLNASNPLTWEDIRLLDILTCKVDMYCDLEEKEHYEEILKRFKAQKKENSYDK